MSRDVARFLERAVAALGGAGERAKRSAAGKIARHGGAGGTA